MRPRFFIKRFPKPIKNNYINVEEIVKEDITTEEISQDKKNKKNKKKDNMDTEMTNKLKQAEATLNNMEREVKVVKSDKGLIERTESSKIILAEDNRQLLVD
jgi:hypothetical protein